MDKALSIIGYFHLAVPEHNAGSETTVWAALRAMAQRGHHVRIMCDRSTTAPYTLDGIEVVRPPRRGTQTWIENYVRDADLLVTHLDLTSLAMQLAITTKKPLVHFVHNDAQLTFWHVNTLKAQLVVFNSHWIAEKEVAWDYGQKPCAWPGPSIVVHPVVEPQHYRSERGQMVTLVNPTSGKGSGTFYALARQMPEQDFLTVQGGYGIQQPCPRRGEQGIQGVFYDDRGGEVVCESHLPNVTHAKNHPDIRETFRRTKVLLMPSDYESYGRVAVEAACAGIPTIAHPTVGLKEALGSAGIYHDRNDVSAWKDEIERLLTDEIYYRRRSEAALKLAESLEPESEFDRLEEALVRTVKVWEQTRGGRAVKMWTTDRRLYYTADRKITDKKELAVSLCCGIGGQIPADVARELGFIGPEQGEQFAEQTEVLLDTKALSAPPENKAIESPEENKGKKRKSKVA